MLYLRGVAQQKGPLTQLFYYLISFLFAKSRLAQISVPWRPCPHLMIYSSRLVDDWIDVYSFFTSHAIPPSQRIISGSPVDIKATALDSNTQHLSMLITTDCHCDSDFHTSCEHHLIAVASQVTDFQELRPETSDITSL